LVYNLQLRNVDRAKCIVYPTDPTLGRAIASPAHYVPAPLSSCLCCCTVAAGRVGPNASGECQRDCIGRNRPSTTAAKCEYQHMPHFCH